MSVETKKLPQELRDALRMPLPDNALKQHGGKSFLSSINPIYIIERMNDVFGIGGWTYEPTVLRMPEKGSMPLMHVRLCVPAYDIVLHGFGGSKNDDQGDELKGSLTDALTNATKQLEIGLDIYKGYQSHNKPARAVQTEVPPMDSIPCKVCKAPMKYFKAGIGKASGKPYPAFYKCDPCNSSITAV